MVLIFTGNGKGKTTAALGQAMRAVGEGKKVLMIQFIKGPWRSGEDLLLENFQFFPRSFSMTGIPAAESGLGTIFNFQIRKTGLGFVGIMGDNLPFEKHKEAAEGGLVLARKEVDSGNWDILILDEINNAVSLNLISKEKALEFIDYAGKRLEHLIFTGRDAPQEFIDKADLVTEMKDIKHPYQKGIRGKRGLEY